MSPGLLGRGLGCFLEGREGWQKSGACRRSRRIGGDFRPVRGRRKMVRVGGSREDVDWLKVCCGRVGGGMVVGVRIG